MTGRTAPPSRADRLFRALLRLLPLDFRSAHGREMEQVFRAQRGDARGGGTLLTLARLWIETVQDILTTVHTQYYNSGTMLGCDGRVYAQGTIDFLTALASSCRAVCGRTRSRSGCRPPAGPPAAGRSRRRWSPRR